MGEMRGILVSQLQMSIWENNSQNAAVETTWRKPFRMNNKSDEPTSNL